MELNKLGVDTASGKSGKQWHPSTVSNQIKRIINNLNDQTV
jgi:hypothetical protein